MIPIRTFVFAGVLLLPVIGLGGTRSEPISVPPAVHHAGDPADTLYQVAREALSRGDYREAARLFGRIVEEEPDSEYAPDALYWRAFALYRVGGTDELRSAIGALERQRERYPDAATRGDAETLLVRIRGALARRGDADAAQRVMAAAQGTGDCPSEDQEMRTAALNALIHMDPDRALPILEKVLARHDACAAELRRRAVFLVAESDSERAGEILLDVARTDPDPAVRAQAVFWLAEVEGDFALAALEDILMSSADAQVREGALFALSQHESDRAGRILREFALDAAQPAELRERAIFWLSEHESVENVAFLKSLFARIDDPSLRERILFAVANAEEEDAVPWLIEVSRDASLPSELRGRALFWAGETGAAAAPELLALWDRVDDPEIRQQLLFVYSQMESPAAVDRLFEIARSEADVELRKRALFWLGQSDDPRAAAFIERMVTDP